MGEGVELGVQETGVDAAYDEVFEDANGREGEGLEEIGVGEGGVGVAEGEEG